MTKTVYIVVVAMTNSGGITRVVYEENGNYFVKYNGEIRNVNHLKDRFYRP